MSESSEYLKFSIKMWGPNAVWKSAVRAVLKRLKRISGLGPPISPSGQ